MSKRQAREQKKFSREKKKKERSRNKNDYEIELSLPATPTAGSSRNTSAKDTADRKITGRKTLIKNRDANKKKMERLEAEATKKGREALKWKQNFYRQKSKQMSPSPNKLSKTIMKKGSDEVGKPLYFGWALVKQLKKIVPK